MGNPEAVIAVRNLLTEWQALRIVIAELEAAEHPDMTDSHGRVWTWWKGDLYRHDSLAWPREAVQAGIGLPEASLFDNPNYRWCELCRQLGPRAPAARPAVRSIVTVELPDPVGADR